MTFDVTKLDLTRIKGELQPEYRQLAANTYKELQMQRIGKIIASVMIAVVGIAGVILAINFFAEHYSYDQDIAGAGSTLIALSGTSLTLALACYVGRSSEHEGRYVHGYSHDQNQGWNYNYILFNAYVLTKWKKAEKQTELPPQNNANDPGANRGWSASHIDVRTIAAGRVDEYRLVAEETYTEFSLSSDAKTGLGWFIASTIAGAIILSVTLFAHRYAYDINIAGSGGAALTLVGAGIGASLLTYLIVKESHDSMYEQMSMLTWPTRVRWREKLREEQREQARVEVVADVPAKAAGNNAVVDSMLPKPVSN